MSQTVTTSNTDYILRDIERCIEQNFPRAKHQPYSYSDDLFEAGIVDSLGFLTLIGFIEQHFNIAVSDEDVIPQNFASIDAMAKYVQESLDP